MWLSGRNSKRQTHSVFSSVPTWWRLSRHSDCPSLHGVHSFVVVWLPKWTTQLHSSLKNITMLHTRTHTHNIIIIIMRGRFAYILQIYQVSSQKGVYSDALFQSSTPPTTKVTSRSCKKQRFLNSWIVSENIHMCEHHWTSIWTHFPSKTLCQRQNSIWTLRSFVNLWSTTYNHIQTCSAYMHTLHYS